MTDLPPFISGKAAFKSGQPISANPHDAAEAFDASDYPGKWAMWRDGWMNAKACAEHDAKLRDKI
jgi:hypothetical protein